MTKIKITNPYYDQTYVVKENVGEVESCLRHIKDGYEEFLLLHTNGGELITLSPRYLASCEIVGETE